MAGSPNYRESAKAGEAPAGAGPPSGGPFRRPVRDFIVTVYVFAVAVGGAAGLYWLTRHAVAIHRLTRGVGDTVFLAGDGRPWFRLDESRRDVPLDAVSPHLRQAVVAVEDHRFYSHLGLDPVALGRALSQNLVSRHVVEGGSTLTQQLARTLFLSNRRSLGRKAKEAVLALLLEQQLSKDQILELYLNRVYMGARSYGVETMSRRCFGKPARDVSLAEAAVLAGLIQAPSALSPWNNPDGARRRAKVVLSRMRDEGYITAGDHARATRTFVNFGPAPRPSTTRWGYAKDYLREAFAGAVGVGHPPDWQVETTLDPDLQDAAEAAVEAGLRRRPASLQAALVALDPETGNILAIVGGRDAALFPYNRAQRARRQPGSAFKPFVYATALEHGWNPVSVLQNLDAVVVSGAQEEWSPRNDHDTPEEQTLREALYESNNAAAVALQQKIGSGRVRRLAGQLGLGDLPDVPSLALGSGLVTPLDLTAAYAAFPNGGDAVRPRPIRRILDEEGDVAFEQPVVRRKVLSRQTAFQVVTMLRDVVERGTGSPASAWGVRFPAGGKTGTTNEFKDAWFVGFTTEVVAGVWVGFDRPAPIADRGYGARVALPIWADFMRRAAKTLPPARFGVPGGLVEAELCRVSFQKPVTGCPTYTEYLKPGDAAPKRLCDVHRGELKQRVKRAIDGFFDELGREIRDAFRGRRDD